jgi:hypothetical protein
MEMNESIGVKWLPTAVAEFRSHLQFFGLPAPNGLAPLARKF